MTREEAKKLAPIIQAYGQGLPVQVSLGVIWEDYKDEQAEFGNPNWKWRIKPEPREFWIVLDPVELSGASDSRVGARVYIEPVCSEHIEVVHVREVLK